MLGIVAWALAATLAGFVAWWGVTVIGGQSGASQEGVLSPAQVAAVLATESATTPSVSPGSSPSPSTTPSPSRSPSPTPSPSLTDDAPAAEEVVRTWRVNGGTVGAACRGSVISLLYATPADGWTLEIKDTGPNRVEVEFDRRERETKVRASCASGTPAASIEDDDDQD